MSKQEVGLCALFTGSSTTAEAFGVLPAHVESCIQEIRFEVSPTLKALRDVIRSHALETDLAKTAELFKMPLSVLKIVVGQLPPASPALKPSAPASRAEVSKSPRPKKPVELPVKKAAELPAKKAVEGAKKTAAQKKAEEASVIPPVSEPHNAEAAVEKKAPKIAVKERTAPAATSLAEADEVATLRKKINSLYTSGVKATIISALYKLPVQLVHTWGDWTQLPQAKADENRSLSNSAKDLLASGVHEREVMEALGLKNHKTYSYLLGNFEMPKSYSSDQKTSSVDYTRLVRNIKKAAEELDIPHKRLRSWVNKEDLSSDEDFLSCGKGTKKDEERLQALEEYYMNNKSVSAAAKKTGHIDVYKIINWVTEFEKNSLSTPKKRQKVAEVPETLEVED